MTNSYSWFRLDRFDEPTTEPATGGLFLEPATAPRATEPEPTPDPAPTGQDPNAPVDVSALPPNVRKLITDLRKENGTHRQGRTAAEQAATAAQERHDAVLKALGLQPDGTEDPGDPQAAISELAERVERAEARAWTVGVKSDIYDLAAAAGANPRLCFNSDEFRDLLDDLTEDEPGTPEFRTAISEKLRQFAADNPDYAARPAAGTPTPPPAPKPDRSQGRTGNNEPVNYRTAPREELDAYLATLGIRQPRR